MRSIPSNYYDLKTAKRVDTSLSSRTQSTSFHRFSCKKYTSGESGGCPADSPDIANEPLVSSFHLHPGPIRHHRISPSSSSLRFDPKAVRRSIATSRLPRGGFLVFQILMDCVRVSQSEHPLFSFPKVLPYVPADYGGQYQRDQQQNIPDPGRLFLHRVSPLCSRSPTSSSSYVFSLRSDRVCRGRQPS